MLSCFNVVEIKRAYRSKARDTHPDKQRGVDPEVAAKAFREVVEAYEVLSDESARRGYDLTGRVGNAQQGHSQQRQGSSWSWSWSSNANAGRNGGDRSHQRNQHRYLFDRMRRVHIRDAQSRVISIRSLDQLKTVIVDDDSETKITERYTLLSFVDTSSASCINSLNDEVLYPWPFSGYNYEGNAGSSDSGMWWEVS